MEIIFSLYAMEIKSDCFFIWDSLLSFELGWFCVCSQVLINCGINHQFSITLNVTVPLLPLITFFHFGALEEEETDKWSLQTILKDRKNEMGG